jgi:hypothetical protein
MHIISELGGVKKEQNFFDLLLEREFEPQIFSNFPTHDLNIHGN